jgi:hypothetical protein
LAWPEVTFDSWQHFVRMTESLTLGSPAYLSYIYRGQSSAAWGLVPSLTRRLRDAATPADVHETERAALKEFKLQAALHADAPERIRLFNPSLPEWWGLMQHYQAPTRLLDWTRSPFVAAYFACAASPGTDGSIWLFHVRDMTQGMHGRHGDFLAANSDWESRYQNANPPPAIELFTPQQATVTPRMIAQQGLFTVALDAREHHDRLIESVLHDVRSALVGNSTVFNKVVVPAGLKPVFLRHLRSMNVTASTLFPGIDGLGRSVSEMVDLHLNTLTHGSA